jgi:hypothetical protein
MERGGKHEEEGGGRRGGKGWERGKVFSPSGSMQPVKAFMSAFQDSALRASQHWSQHNKVSLGVVS